MASRWRDERTRRGRRGGGRWAPILLAVVAACEPAAENPDAGEVGVAAAEPRVYTSPDDFALPFSATVPPGIEVEATGTGEGDAVEFVARSGESRDDRAFLHLFVAPEGESEGAVRETVRAVAESYRIPGDRTEVDPLPPQPWAVVRYDIRSTGTVREPLSGWVALGRHGDRWFHFILQQPERLEDRVAPDLEGILDSWRWLDDGTPLVGGA